MAAPSWVPPEEFDEYRLVRRLGHGAMGQVWLAHDSTLERRVAIKFLSALEPGPEVRERFLVEARAIARLSHPNVVTVHRTGTCEGQPFTVTEFIDGRPLDQLDKPLESARVLSLGIDLARGLAAAHRAGVLHRDLKPANAIVGDGGAKVLDFGLATLGPSLANDGLVGTPYYAAPECWAGAPASRRSDVYSLGALLYELCAGQPPSRYLPEGPLREVVARFDNRPLAEVAPHVDVRLVAVIDRCLRRAPEDRFASGDELREALESLERTRRTVVPEGNPFRGLAAFQQEHRALFFGRGLEVRAVVERLRGGALVVVTGDSGAGKSSLCRAGVVPAVTEGALGQGRTWKAVSYLPGRHPLAALLGACAAQLGVAVEALRARVRDEPTELARALSAAAGRDTGWLLFVDQLEEWVGAADPAEADVAARALAACCTGHPGIRVLATARSDLLPALAALPDLGAELGASLFFLGAIGREELREVVEGPARAAAVRFETPQLVDELVEFGATGGALPSLQFALSQLWERREADLLSQRALRELGGPGGALARHADQVLAGMSEAHAVAAREVLLLLVKGKDQRRRRLDDDLIAGEPARRAALATLARERLVLARDSAEGAGWELAHEALLREWPTLVDWLRDDAAARALRERLEAASTEWERLGRPVDALWGARQLSELDRLAPGLTTFSPFVASSRRRVFLMRLAAPAVVGSLLLVGLASFGLVRQVQARELDARVERQVALGQVALEQAQALAPRWKERRRAALSAFDSGDYAAGETGWSEAAALALDVTRALTNADGALESARAADPQSPRLGPFALGLAQLRLALAVEGDDPLGRAVARASLRALVPVEDSTPRVTFDVSPAGAELTVSRVLPDYTEGAPRGVGREAQLEAGTWVLVVRCAGCLDTRLPFEVREGEPTQVQVEVPRLAEAPRGFVFVPRGESYVGSSADESVRRDFYEAPPLHRAEVPAFFIARHELTFADWLDYLDALPTAERAERTPRVASNLGVTQGARLELTRGGGGWRWAMTPVTAHLVASEDGRFDYPARRTLQQHDWRQLPVVGVTPLDLAAYAAWLDSSGRVPGARLCTEREWERAARGADRRTLPHGDVAAPLDGNIDATYGRVDDAFGPDTVGSHPHSRSPFGVDDLLGNVWEIVTPANRAKSWVAKGGAWNVSLLVARIPNNWVLNDGFRQVETGGRLCVSWPLR